MAPVVALCGNSRDTLHVYEMPALSMRVCRYESLHMYTRSVRSESVMEWPKPQSDEVIHDGSGQTRRRPLLRSALIILHVGKIRSVQIRQVQLFIKPAFMISR